MLDGNWQEGNGTLGIKLKKKIEGSDNVNSDDWSWYKKRMMIEFEKKRREKKRKWVSSHFSIYYTTNFFTQWESREWDKILMHICVCVYIYYNIKKMSVIVLVKGRRLKIKFFNFFLLSFKNTNDGGDDDCLWWWWESLFPALLSCGLYLFLSLSLV